MRYRVVHDDGETREIESAGGDCPIRTLDRARSRSRTIVATIHVPHEYVGLGARSSARTAAAMQRDMDRPRPSRQVRYELPLAEVVLDFHDRMKSATRGYGSLDYELDRATGRTTS